MSTHPFIPLYVDDYEAATAHLSPEEDGVYNRLLRLCWRTPGCSLPNDPAWIARKIRVSPTDYERLVQPLLDEFFSLSRGRLSQRRLKREYDDISRKKTARKLAGKKGGEAKAAKTQEKSPSNATVLPADTRAFPEPYPEPEREVGKTPKPPAELQGLFERAWSAFPEHGRRRSSRAKAQAAWKKAATGAGGEADLLATVLRYAEDPDTLREDGQYVPAMDRWLRDGRWEHYRGGFSRPARPGGLIDTPSERQQRSWMEDWRDKGRPAWRQHERGPYPGEEGCRVAPAIQREFGVEPFTADLLTMGRAVA